MKMEKRKYNDQKFTEEDGQNYVHDQLISSYYQHSQSLTNEEDEQLQQEANLDEK